MGLCVLPEMQNIIGSQKEYAAWYDELLDGCSLRRPVAPVGLEYNYAFYPVVFPSHEVMMRVRRSLLDQGIGSRRYFHPSMDSLPLLTRTQERPCPVSQSISSRVLCLPMYIGLRKADVEVICGVIQRA
jgi:dTDP-4-amino-4,6-dideoxygalactose transaminase